jgi:hypothetical protein
MKTKKRESAKAGSFPAFPLHRLIGYQAKKRWQVLCGDKNHWRIGYYSPPEGKPADVKELEKHTCVELFMLLSGAVTLIVDDGKGEKQLKLEAMKPVMVSGWHSGFCPKGPNTGVALVVERDRFSTIYRARRGRSHSSSK